MKKNSVMILHSLCWAIAILLLAGWLQRNAMQHSWLFFAVGAWFCSHSLVQYGFCRRRQLQASDQNPEIQSQSCKLFQQ